MYYRLTEPLKLRGYEDQLLLLDTPHECRPISAALFRLLSRCDGVTPIAEESDSEKAALDTLVQRGLVDACETPTPIKPYQEYRHFPHRRVLAAQWSITGRCNLRCRHCFMASDTQAAPAQFSYEEALHVIDQLLQCDIRDVMLTGGEPLLHPRFADIVRAAVQAGISISRLYTNAVLLNEQHLALFEQLGQKPEMVFSFDGFGTHDWMRGVPGAEEAVLRAIRLCVSRGYHVQCAVNLNAVTLPVAVDSAKRLREMGVDGLFFIRTSEAPKWLKSKQHSLSVQEYCAAVVQLTAELLPLIREGLYVHFFNAFIIYPHTTPDTLRQSTQKRPAMDAPYSAWSGKCRNTIFISSEGRVMPCDGFEGGAKESGFLGTDNSMKTRRLADILREGQYADLLRLSANRVLCHNPECHACPWRELCLGGGCRACAAVGNALKTGRFEPSALCLRTPITCELYRGGHYSRICELLEGCPPKGR